MTNLKVETRYLTLMSPASITMPSIQQALDISLLIEGINKPINESEERKYIQKRKRGFSEEDS